MKRRIKKGTECEIIGKNCVTFLDLRITMLNNGDKFCLKTWKPIL